MWNKGTTFLKRSTNSITSPNMIRCLWGACCELWLTVPVKPNLVPFGSNPTHSDIWATDCPLSLVYSMKVYVRVFLSSTCFHTICFHSIQEIQFISTATRKLAKNERRFHNDSDFGKILKCIASVRGHFYWTRRLTQFSIKVNADRQLTNHMWKPVSMGLILPWWQLSGQN